MKNQWLITGAELCKGGGAILKIFKIYIYIYNYFNVLKI